MPMVVMHRATLLSVLSEAAGRARIRLGAEFMRVQQATTSVLASFTDGHPQRGDLLIGADGVRSQVRAQLFGELG
jgi:salicylate hydroxylase